PFGVRRHHSVLDAVVHHLYEMAGPVWAAVQITLVGAGLHPIRSDWHCARTRRQCRKYGFEVGKRSGFATHHKAIASLEAGHAAAGTHIHVMDALRSQLGRTSYVIVIRRIASVNDDIVFLHQW